MGKYTGALLHEITTRFLNDIFLKKNEFFSKILCRDFWEFSDLNQSENIWVAGTGDWHCEHDIYEKILSFSKKK